MKKAIRLYVGAISLAFCAITTAGAANSITYTVGQWRITMTDLGLLPGGSMSSGSNAGTISGISSHVYTRIGSFKARLIVTDGKGAAGSSTAIMVRVR